MANPRTTIVVPNYNGAAHLESLLPSIAAQTRAAARVIVVDNNSSDNSRTVVADSAIWRSLDKNYGFAYAVNRGIELVDTDFVAIVNNDIILDSHWLEALENTLADPHCAFACPLLRAAHSPNLIDGTWDLLSRSGCPLRALHGESLSTPQVQSPRDIVFPPMTAALFRTSVFRQLGGLDESFQNYLEDVDFGLRAALAGFRGRFVPSASAAHTGSATLGAWSHRSTYWNARNQVLLLARHYPTTLLRRWCFPIFTGQLLYLLLAARHGQLFAAIRGKTEILRSWSQWRQAVNSDPVHTLTLQHLLEQGDRDIAALVGSGNSCPLFWKLYFLLNRLPTSEAR